MHGIEQNLDPGPLTAGNAYERSDLEVVPMNLRDAITALDRSDAMRSAFGDEVIEHYLHAARWEQSEHDRQVTDLERRRMFERG